MSQYLEAARRGRLTPNFFMAERYMMAARWWEDERSGVLSVRLSDGALVLPQITEAGKLIVANEPVLIDIEGYVGRSESKPFDLEFIYKAGSFADLSGGDRKVFRKNTRHFAEEFGPVSIRPASPDELWETFEAWIAQHDEIEDFETMLRYLEFGAFAAVCRAGVVGILAWDSSWDGVNFRYCFASGLPWASEAARLAFMLSLEGSTTVNDGGTLGLEELERFKRKLGPVEIRQRRSWE